MYVQSWCTRRIYQHLAARCDVFITSGIYPAVSGLTSVFPCLWHRVLWVYCVGKPTSITSPSRTFDLVVGLCDPDDVLDERASSDRRDRFPAGWIKAGSITPDLHRSTKITHTPAPQSSCLAFDVKLVLWSIFHGSLTSAFGSSFLQSSTRFSSFFPSWDGLPL
ncbi:hypothetical protein GGR57DRAFT_20939 [Xylariaceae sp. FL1272]|nr:hypothetical protein GGR57DRAFT_20939 [Xylariaceae sp. FL1272]